MPRLGMSCADMLAQHPARFAVTVVEAEDYCGGQAFSIPLDAERYGAAWLNQGVQGCVARVVDVGTGWAVLRLGRAGARGSITTRGGCWWSRDLMSSRGC